jgi:CHAD domain-containing protein
MTVWIEVALQAFGHAGAGPAPLASLEGALRSVPAFGACDPSHARVATREIALRAPRWRLAIDTQDGARTLCAVQEIGPALPGFTRYRTYARPAGAELAPSLREFAESEEILHAPLADVTPAEDEPGRDVERVEWRIDANGADILATLEVSADRPATLRLAALAVNESIDALFRLAAEVIEAAPFCIGLTDADAGSEPIFAVTLELPRDATRRQAFAMIAASIAAQWFGNEAAARAGLADEHVHQLRVAQRRLKTALKLFRDDIDDTWNERVAPGLKWFGDLLADARDWDVFTDKTLPAYAQADDAPERWQTLVESADGKRRAARERVRDALASKRHARLALAFIEWLARFTTRDDDAPESFVGFARKRVRNDYRRIARVPDLGALDAHTRHRVRIHAKRLRYALEFFRSATTRRTRKETARLLGELQGVLGEANDAAVAAARLSSIAEASEYQRGFARAWGAASAKKDAQEGERLLRSMRRPRLKASI